MQKVRHRLVYMLDQLFDLLERDPGFVSFHLDSQTAPLQDYLEIRPERREALARLIRDGRLVVGPWFTLPDENCVGGESLIRNLLLGHRIAAEFGPVSKTGYSPFSWGQISQMPQLYRGFGILFAAFYRGINTRVAPRSEFIWEGADGTRIAASRLGRRPRYNIYYIVQRAAFWDVADIDHKHERWNNGHGPWRMAAPGFEDRDYDYLHPAFRYAADTIPARARQALAEQDDDWSTPHRFWSIGHDASFPDVREPALIRDCAEALKDRADVFHSTVERFQRGLLEADTSDWPVLQGEMRHPSSDKDYSPLLGWVTSARMYIKQENFRTERDLTAVAEPLAFFAHALGAPHPEGFLRTAYNWLLQNHGHDSIGGCSRDIIHDDMMYRYRQAREIARCVTEEALLEVSRAIDFSGWKPEEVALVAYLPAAGGRTRVASCLVDLPEGWAGESFAVLDETGRALPAQARLAQRGHYGLLNAQGDVPTTLRSDRHRVEVELPDLPGFGYRTFRLVPAAARSAAEPSLRTGPDTLENEFLRVRINPNGTLRVEDKSTGRSHDQLGYFRDTSEKGNPWEHVAVADDRPFTSREAVARVAVLEEGPVCAAFRVELELSIPADLNADRSARSAERVPLRIVNTVRLRRGERWVAVETELENRARNHYLQVCFPTGLRTPTVRVQTPFDTVERACGLPDPALYAEAPQGEQPMDGFVDRCDGRSGLAVLNEGLKAYQAEDDAEGTVSLTLLRCFSLLIWQTWKVSDYSAYDPGSQCPGTHRYRYAILPHGGLRAEELWRETEHFQREPIAAIMSPAGAGSEPPARSFLEVAPDTVHVSAVKKGERNGGWIVRLFNPGDGPVTVRVRLNGGHAPPPTASPVDRIKAEYRAPAVEKRRWESAQRVTLEECPESPLALEADGATRLVLGPRKIQTVEFLAR